MIGKTSNAHSDWQAPRNQDMDAARMVDGETSNVHSDWQAPGNGTRTSDESNTVKTSNVHSDWQAPRNRHMDVETPDDGLDNGEHMECAI